MPTPTYIHDVVAALVRLHSADLAPDVAIDELRWHDPLIHSWSVVPAQSHPLVLQLVTLTRDQSRRLGPQHDTDDELSDALEQIAALLDPSGNPWRLFPATRMALLLTGCATALLIACGLSRQVAEYADRLPDGELGVSKLDMKALFGAP